MAENGPIEIGVRVDVDQAAKSIQNFSKQSGRALTSLTLVLQDLPFGFIGIQNNLPALIQTFGALDTKTNGLKGALKDLGAALVGPAGAFLAFSAVTAAVTFAVQKYGSLELAIKSLIGTISQLDIIQKRATDSLEKYNKEILTSGEITADGSAKVSDQIFKLDALSSIVKDNTLSENQRGNALKEIKKLDSERLKSLSLQKEGYEDLDEWVKIYTDSLIANAVAQEYLSKVVATTTQINQQTNLLAEIGKGYTNIAKKRREANEEPIFDPLTGAALTTTILGGLVIAEENLNKQFSDQTTVVNKLYKELDVYKKSALEATKEAINFFKQTKDNKGGKNEFTLGLDPQELDAAFNLESIISNITKYGNALLDTNKSVKERKNALQELIAINPQVFSGLTLEESGLTQNINTLEEYIRILRVLLKSRKDDARASEINTQFRNAQLKSQDAAVKAEEDAFDSLVKLTYGQDQYGNSTDKSTKANNKFLDSLGELQDIDQGVIDILTKGLGVENTYEKAIKNLLNFEEYQKSAVDRISRNFRFLQNPLEDLFGSVLEDGIANWQAFGDTVVAEIKKIAAALLAKSFITLLGNLLAPGVGSLLGAGFSGISDTGLLDFLGEGGKANFSGVQGAGMQLSGAVNLQLRGSDLVGAINRTNSTINRVG